LNFYLDWAVRQAEQAAEKGRFPSQKPEKHTSGAKARVEVIAFMYGLKPVPFTGASFSAACEVMPLLQSFVLFACD